VLTSTSANRSGDPPALAIEEISLGGIAVGMDGGRLALSLPSTVVDPETGIILRHGAVPEAAIRAQFPR
jgi:tRNA A37 threonylcarbamoyladenosine synthetase subunit TsaC/SUA5/YrdC